MRATVSTTRKSIGKPAVAAAVATRHSGFAFQKPLISKVSFPAGRIKVELQDGRTIISDLKRFPEIARLTPAQRRRRGLLEGHGLAFQDLDTVYHVSDFLGADNRP